jgi:uncharacterized protein YejL (UPF0352 family)
MNIRHLIKKSEKKARKAADRENTMIAELLKVLDEHDPSVPEIMTVLLNILAFVVLVGVDKGYREECVFTFINDLPDAIDFLGEQIGVSFDWEEFRTLMEDDGS